jgi:hypothetical protein
MLREFHLDTEPDTKDFLYISSLHFGIVQLSPLRRLYEDILFTLHGIFSFEYCGASLLWTKPLSILLAKILTAVKERHQMYCATEYARSGVNQM